MTGDAAEHAAQAIAREVVRHWAAIDETTVARIARHHIELYQQTLIGSGGGAQDGGEANHDEGSGAKVCGIKQMTTPEDVDEDTATGGVSVHDNQGAQDHQTLRVPGATSPTSGHTTSQAMWVGTNRRRSHSPSCRGSSHMASFSAGAWNDEQALREILNQISSSPTSSRDSSGLLTESALLAESPPLLMSRSLGESEVTASTPAVMHCRPHKVSARVPYEKAYEMTYEDTYSLQELPRAEKSASMSKANENTLNRIIRDLTVPDGLGGQRSASLSLPIQHDTPELQLSDCLTTETADGHLYGQRLSLTGDAEGGIQFANINDFSDYNLGDYGDGNNTGNSKHEAEMKRLASKRLATKRVDECLDEPQKEQDALNFTADPLNFTADFFHSSGSSSTPASKKSTSASKANTPASNNCTPASKSNSTSQSKPPNMAPPVQVLPFSPPDQNVKQAPYPLITANGMPIMTPMSAHGRGPELGQLIPNLAPELLGPGYGLRNTYSQPMGVQPVGAQPMGVQPMGVQPSALNLMLMTGPVGNDDRMSRQIWEDDHVRMVFVSWIPRQLRATQGEKRKAEVSLKRLLRTELGIVGMSKVLLFPPKGTHCKLLFDSQKEASLFVGRYGGPFGSPKSEQWKQDICVACGIEFGSRFNGTSVSVEWAQAPARRVG